MVTAALAACVLVLVACAPALATGDKFHVSEGERVACTPDVLQFCAGAYPDEDRVLACMKAKRGQLSDRCRPVFEAGLKRRGL